VASVAGGSYFCAEGNAKKAQRDCMFSAEKVDVKIGQEKAREEAAAGRIDPLSNLRQIPLVVFSSPKDRITHEGHAVHIRDFFQGFLPAENITQLTHPKAPHGFPTLKEGNPCEKMGIPWLNACDYDLAGEILRRLDQGAEETPREKGKLLHYSQQPYQTKKNQLLGWGGIYVPARCQAGQWGLHVAFHGCQMNAELIGDKFMELSGYQQWADKKNLVILFPQVAKGKGNEQGCWDWFGYTDPKNYINQRGPQIRAIRALIKDLGI
jgi:hypothetical protein